MSCYLRWTKPFPVRGLKARMIRVFMRACTMRLCIFGAKINELFRDDAVIPCLWGLDGCASLLPSHCRTKRVKYPLRYDRANTFIENEK